MQSNHKLHKITDELYGTYEIENILYELLNSDALVRLKQIHQGGGTFLVNNKWNTTRYEHSVGVMLLIRILGGSLEDQILGLLHDVSHTAFSHVIDYIADEKSEDFHEKIFEDVIENSQIPYILNKYNIDHKSLLLKECSILDVPLPEICADRIDYTLRDMYKCGFINKEEVKEFLKSLTVINDKIYITSSEMGEWFTKVYYREVIDFFMHPLNIYANYELTELLKIALSKSIITVDDFRNNDSFLLEKIINSQCIELITKLKSIKANIILIQDETDYDIHKKLKPRMVDPYIYLNNQIIKTSEFSPEINYLITTAIQKLNKGIYLKKITY